MGSMPGAAGLLAGMLGMGLTIPVAAQSRATSSDSAPTRAAAVAPSSVSGRASQRATTRQPTTSAEPTTVPSSERSSSRPASDEASLPSQVYAGPPYRLPYESGDPIPAGYVVEQHSDTGLMWTGAVVWAAGYIGAIVAGPDGEERGSGWALVPVIGPFGALFQQRVECDTDVETLDEVEVATEQCSDEIIDTARMASILLVDGLVQTTGALVFLIGWASTESALVLSDSVEVTPALGQGAYGVSVSGSF